MREIGVKSRKVLAALDRNARVRFADLEKQSGVSQQTARYQLKALMRDGFVQGFSTQVDYSVLGITPYKLLLKTRSASEKTIAEILRYLVELPECIWVVHLDGEFTLAAAFVVPGADYFRQIVNDLYSKFGESIIRRAITTNLSGASLPRGYLSRRSLRAKDPGRYRGRVELDKIDVRILHCLGQNSRSTNSEIVEKIAQMDRNDVVSVSAETVRTRVLRMEKAGVVARYTLGLDCNRFGYSSYTVLLYGGCTNQEQFQRLYAFLYQQKHIVHFVEVIGEWDYEINLEVPDVQTYQDVLSELMSSFPEILRDYRTSLLTRVYKDDSTAGLEVALFGKEQSIRVGRE